MKTERTQDELLNHLDESLKFLKASSDSFDSGFPGEAKRLAVIVRTLIHDTGASHSLLGLLKIKDDMEFYNTAIPYDKTNLAPYHGLVKLFMGSKGGNYVPLLSEKEGLSGHPNNYISFEVWWNEVVIDDKQSNSYTRRGLMDLLANKEGGAHVDSKIDTNYKELNNQMGWKQVIVVDGKEVESPFSDVELYSMRQIAYELLISIERKLKQSSD
jgi:hypothetical protein